MEKWARMPASRRGSRSAMGISPPMMLGRFGCFRRASGRRRWLKSSWLCALASLIFALDVQVKRRREGRPLYFTMRRRAHEAGMIWGSSAFRERPAACAARNAAALVARGALGGGGLADDRRWRRPGGNDRRRAHQGLFDQSRHQHAARRGPGGRRRRAEGECRVSADRRGDGQYRHRARASQ